MRRFYYSFLTPAAFVITMMFAGISCVKNVQDVYPVYYNVSNNSDSRITVVYNDLLFRSGYMSGYTKVADSVVLIEAGQQKTLFVALWNLYKGQNPERDTMLLCMKTLRIYKNDTILSSTNFLLTRYWVFNSMSSSKYSNDLGVGSSDFKH